MHLGMLDAILGVTGGFAVLWVMISFLRKKNVTNYRLPPGPKRNPVFGNLVDLIYSSVIIGEPPFVKFAKWAFQVTSFIVKLLSDESLCVAVPSFEYFFNAYIISSISRKNS